MEAPQSLSFPWNVHSAHPPFPQLEPFSSTQPREIVWKVYVTGRPPGWEGHQSHRSPRPASSVSFPAYENCHHQSGVVCLFFHSSFVLLRPASLTQHNAFKIFPSFSTHRQLYFFPFAFLVVFHLWIYHNQFMPSFIEGYGIFPVASYYKQIYCEHLYRDFCENNISIHFSRVNTQEWSFGVSGQSLFNFIQNHKTIFQSGYTVLHSYQRCMRVPIPCQHFFFQPL